MTQGSDNQTGLPSDIDHPSRPDASPRQARRLQRQCDIAAAGIALVMLILVCALSTTHVTWGSDHFSDMHTLISGENFATHGLFRLRLLPVHYIGPMTDPPSYYTHYPPLPNVVNGLVRILGINSLAVMRMLCGLLCIAGLICMYRAFAPDIGPLPAACGLGFIATSGYFFAYGTSVHQHTYNIFFVGVFFLLFTRAVRSDRPARGLWIGCWVVLMLESLTSFEFILHPQVFAWVYVLATGRLRRRWRGLLVLATAPVAGVGLHFLQNCWALGWSSAMADAAGAFGKTGGETAGAWWSYLSRVPGYLVQHSRVFYAMPWPALLLLPAVLWLPLMDRPLLRGVAVRRAGPLLAAALAGSIVWYVFMPGHAAGHRHTVSQLLPLVLIVMGGVIAVIVQGLIKRQASRPHVVLAVVGAVVVVFAQTQAIAKCLDMSTRRSPFLYVFEAMGENAFPPKTAILTNTDLEAQLAYFIRRPMWRSPTPELSFDPELFASLQKRLPDDWQLRYYVFTTLGDRKVYEPLASTCPGQVLPIPGYSTPHFLIVFDIAALLDPAEERRPLEPAVREAQASRSFPRYDPPGFRERLREVLARHGFRPARRPR